MIKYSKTHEWINTETGEVGITQHALDLLGSIVYFDPLQEGDEVEQYEDAGVIESVKAASDIYAPVSGTVVWINNDALENPEDINGNTILYKIEITGSNEFYNLEDEEIIDG